METKKLADNYLDARRNFQSDGGDLSKINRPIPVAVMQLTQSIISQQVSTPSEIVKVNRQSRVFRPSLKSQVVLLILKILM